MTVLWTIKRNVISMFVTKEQYFLKKILKMCIWYRENGIFKLSYLVMLRHPAMGFKNLHERFYSSVS